MLLRLSNRLYPGEVRLTLFTRQNCSLCEQAKQVVHNVRQRWSFIYHEVDVMDERNKDARIYEFDVPVLQAQSRIRPYDETKPAQWKNWASSTPHDTAKSAKEKQIALGKLMHRFSEEDVKELLAEVYKPFPK